MKNKTVILYGCSFLMLLLLFQFAESAYGRESILEWVKSKADIDGKLTNLCRKYQACQGNHGRATLDEAWLHRRPNGTAFVKAKARVRSKHETKRRCVEIPLAGKKCTPAATIYDYSIYVFLHSEVASGCKIKSAVITASIPGSWTIKRKNLDKLERKYPDCPWR